MLRTHLLPRVRLQMTSCSVTLAQWRSYCRTSGHVWVTQTRITVGLAMDHQTVLSISSAPVEFLIEGVFDRHLPRKSVQSFARGRQCVSSDWDWYLASCSSMFDVTTFACVLTASSSSNLTECLTWLHPDKVPAQVSVVKLQINTGRPWFNLKSALLVFFFVCWWGLC